MIVLELLGRESFAGAKGAALSFVGSDDGPIDGMAATAEAALLATIGFWIFHGVRGPFVGVKF